VEQHIPAKNPAQQAPGFNDPVVTSSMRYRRLLFLLLVLLLLLLSTGVIANPG
jgi:hypothetical protein